MSGGTATLGVMGWGFTVQLMKEKKAIRGSVTPGVMGWWGGVKVKPKKGKENNDFF